MKGLNEILEMDNVVIRKIAETTQEQWLLSDVDALKMPEDLIRGRKNIVHAEKILIPNPCKLVGRPKNRTALKIIRKNSAAGYVITFEAGQCSTVRFSKKRDGFGATIEAAYADYRMKQGA